METDPFDEWVHTINHPCIQKWADRLIELGASWDSFRRDADDVVNDLVKGGIPLLAAWDIVNLARAAVSRSEAPMAIFWDLENMPIPKASSGRDVVARLKSILAPHGDLIQFRCYANIALGLIPQQKRSELQLSGCHLVDCPHIGRKEVADKMIIVDAMQFAFTNPNGATLCFITGDVDYAYLLAVIQRPQWKTIVISKGTISSMLHVNCDMKMRWETDILQLRSALLSSVHPSSQTSKAASPSRETSLDCVDENSECSTTSSFGALTDAEQWTDDVELLRTLLRKSQNQSENTDSVLKSFVGLTLRRTNPVRFPNRQVLQDFLAKAIEKSVVIEIGDGPKKCFLLPPDLDSSTMQPPFEALSDAEEWKDDIEVLRTVMRKLQNQSTDGNSLLKSRVGLTLRATNPARFPNRKSIKDFLAKVIEKGVVIEIGNGANRAFCLAQESSGMRPCTPPVKSLDCRQDDHQVSDIGDNDLAKFQNCTECIEICETIDMMISRHTNELFCQSCFLSTDHLWNVEDKVLGANRVTGLLEVMAENDDTYVLEYIIQKQLYLRWPDECISRKQATLWISEAVETGQVLQFKKTGANISGVCLPKYFNEWANAPSNPEDTDTIKEEEHVKNLLIENNGWMARTDVIADIKEKFETMGTQLMRNKMFYKAAQNNTFFVEKGGYGHIVGLTKEDAISAMQIAFKEKIRSVEVNDTESSSNSQEAVLASPSSSKSALF